MCKVLLELLAKDSGPGGKMLFVLSLWVTAKEIEGKSKRLFDETVKTNGDDK